MTFLTSKENKLSRTTYLDDISLVLVVKVGKLWWQAFSFGKTAYEYAIFEI